MILLLQRVIKANVEVNAKCIAKIDAGLLVFCGFEAGDDNTNIDKLLHKLLAYRIFSDLNGRMNLSVTDIAGGILLVPQFTLAADTKKGLRPSFSSAANPETGKLLFKQACEQLKNAHPLSAFGQFGADMQVSLTNDGPVTFYLQG